MSRELNQLHMLAELNGAYVLRAVSENETTIAAALFMESAVSREEVHLMHMYVHPEWREKYLAKQLLQYAEAYFADRGIHAFRVKCCGDVLKLEGIYEFLIGEAFVPLVVQGRLLRYQVADLLESEFAAKIGLLEKHMRYIHTISDWNDPRIQAFLKTGVLLPQSCFDPRLFRFFIVEGRIMAALCAEQLRENLLYFYNLVMTEDCPRQVAVVALMAAFIQELKNSAPEDAVLIMQSDLSGIYRGLRAQFGKPDAELLAHEYYYRLGSREYSAEFLGTNESIRFEWVSSSHEEGGGDIINELPMYSGIGDAERTCLRHPAGMVPGFVGWARRRLQDPVWIKEWRTELNEWMAQLGRQPYAPEKILPFEAYLRADRPQPLVASADAPEQVAENQLKEKLTYFVFPQRMEALANIMPEYLRASWRQGKLVAVGGKNFRGEIIAYAVFSSQAMPKMTMLLEYLFVNFNYRKNGYGREILRYAGDLLTGIGIRGISAKQVGTAEQTAGVHRFLQETGFLQLTPTTKVVIHYLQDLLETDFLDPDVDEMFGLPKVEKISNREDYLLRQLAKEAPQYGFLLDRVNFDSRFARFYVRPDGIRAMMRMEQAADNLLLYKDAWYAPGYDTPQMRVALLRTLLYEAGARMRDDAVVVLQFDQNWNFEAIRDLMGDGESELRLYEYLLPLK